MDIHSMVLDEQPELVWNSIDETDEDVEEKVVDGDDEENDDDDDEEEDDWKTATDEMISIPLSCTEHECSEIEDDVI